MKLPRRKTQAPVLASLPPWETETVYDSIKTWFTDQIADIDGAQSAINLQMYIFCLDDCGQAFLDALVRAAKRGVKVRVIVDGIGSGDYIEQLRDALHAVGAEFRVYHPLPTQWASGKLERKTGKLFGFLRRLTFINKRNHSKLCLIDNQIGWVGSFNITNNYCDELDGDDIWQECGARVTGERIILLQQFFAAVWTGDKRQLKPALFAMHPITNWGHQLKVIRYLSTANTMQNARRRIWIASAYFAPREKILNAITEAAERGVDVRIITPEKSDVKFFPLLTATYYADLIKRNARCFEYKNTMFHSKFMLIDDQVIIGSSNMNHRSSLHDIELDINLFSEQARAEVEREFLENQQHSRELTVENLPYIYGRWRLVGLIPRLLRYFL